jgi:hypothetical protein
MTLTNKVILISHRGNYKMPDKDKENNPVQISYMLDKGWNVEVDVWHDSGKFYLGHDKPKYEIKTSFLKNNNLWCHAKNLSALQHMLNLGVHCFWHQKDDYTITSRGYIWTYPKKSVCNNSIIVCETLEDTIKHFKMNVAGICSDYLGEIV